MGIPVEQLTEAMITALRDAALQEGFGLEYKRIAEKTAVLRAVSAMANTFGGVILVGVDELRDDPHKVFGFPGEIVGVDPGDRAKIAAWCHSSLAPPYDPQIGSVRLDTGKVVLVIRVQPPPVLPIVFDGRAMVRTDDGNRPADWFRLRQLFTESAAGSAGDILPNWVSQQDDDLSSRDPKPDLLLRSACFFALARPAARHSITSAARIGLMGALRSSALDTSLQQISRSSDYSPWYEAGHSTASSFQLRWTAFPMGPGVAYPEGRIRVELPPSAHSSGGLLVLTDVAFRFSAIRILDDPSGAGPSLKLSLQELGSLLEGLIASSVDLISPRASALAGEQTGPMFGPLVIVKSTQPIGKVIELGGAQLIPDNVPSITGATLVPDERLRLSDAKDRRQQVRGWLQEVLLDNHYRAPEAFVKHAWPES